jgi:hypothetical protein
MGFRRVGYSFIRVLAGLALGCCAHPEGHKDLLAFLQDGGTTKDEVETRIGPAFVWDDGRLWTYRVGEATEGYYLSAQKGGSDARYSLVLKFDPNRVPIARRSSMSRHRHEVDSAACFGICRAACCLRSYSAAPFTN